VRGLDPEREIGLEAVGVGTVVFGNTEGDWEIGEVLRLLDGFGGSTSSSKGLYFLGFGNSCGRSSSSGTVSTSSREGLFVVVVGIAGNGALFTFMGGCGVLEPGKGMGDDSISSSTSSCPECSSSGCLVSVHFSLSGTSFLKG